MSNPPAKQAALGKPIKVYMKTLAGKDMPLFQAYHTVLVTSESDAAYVRQKIVEKVGMEKIESSFIIGVRHPKMMNMEEGEPRVRRCSLYRPSAPIRTATPRDASLPFRPRLHHLPGPGQGPGQGQGPRARAGARAVAGQGPEGRTGDILG